MVKNIPQLAQSILEQGGTVYDACGFWLYVKQTGGGMFTIHTRNDNVWLQAYMEIDYRHTFAEAQQDLDAFAQRYSLPVLFAPEKPYEETIHA